MLRVYGISNCDTVKKAKAFLDNEKIDYEFIDFKKNPPNKKSLSIWASFAGELPVNKKGTTYKKVKDEYESKNESEKIELILSNSSMIKRPIFERDNKVICLGFNEEELRKNILG